MSGDSSERIASDAGQQFLETEVDPQRMEVFIEAMTPPAPQHLRRLEEEALAGGVPIIRPQTRNLIRFFIKLKKPSRILEVGTAVGFSSLFMQCYAPAGCRIITIEKDPVRAAMARKNIEQYGARPASVEVPENGTVAGTPASVEVPESGTGPGTPTSVEVPENGTAAGTPASVEVPGNGTAAGTPASIEVPENGTAAGTPASIEVLEGDAAEVLREIREDGSFDLIFMDAAKGQYIRFLPEVLRLLRSGGILLTDNILQEGDVLSSRFAVTRRNRTIHKRMREYVRALTEEPMLETLLLPTGDGAAVCSKV